MTITPSQGTTHTHAWTLERDVPRGSDVPAVLEAGGADELRLPGGDFLMAARYGRAGDDLILSHEDGTHVTVRDYFAERFPPDLIADGGIRIPPDWAAKLAGSPPPVQVAQAVSAPGAQPIGTVTEATGLITSVRTGGSQTTLGVGDSVFLGDVLEASPDGSLKLLFVDGTRFAMSPNARMTVDELIYDPGAAQGSAVFSVLQGTVSFVSGAIADTGADAMSIRTPVATIGIRGSAGFVTVFYDAAGNVAQITVTMTDGIGQLLINGVEIGPAVDGDPTTPNTVDYVPGQEPTVRTLSPDEIEAVHSGQTLASLGDLSPAAGGIIGGGGGFVSVTSSGNYSGPYEYGEVSLPGGITVQVVQAPAAPESGGPGGGAPDGDDSNGELQFQVFFLEDDDEGEEEGGGGEPDIIIDVFDAEPVIEPIFVPDPGGGPFIVTPSANGALLAETILGEGITIVPDSISFTGSDISAGTFSGGLAAGIGIAEGIILTSGDVTLAPGPNEDDGATGDNGLPGDPDLDALIPEETFDATVLEFQFETEGGDLFFNFVFASEEYNEFVNAGFNDVFAFFLDGVNIALVPGTDTPVSIDTVNSGNPFDPTGATGVNPQFFVNNDPSDGGPFFDIQYDGFTTTFSATALGIGPGVHSIKLAIADAGDPTLDSAVFIQASSFSDQPVDVFATFPVRLSAASSSTVTVDFTTADGTATAGEDYEPISGTLIFEPGETEAFVQVRILSDEAQEGLETFFLELSNPVGATIGDPQGEGSILDPEPVPQLAVSGAAIDGYLWGSTVFADTDGNGTPGPGEVAALTDLSGGFALAVDAGATGPLVLTGGLDISTNLTFDVALRAPEGATVVTPLSTLVADVVDLGESAPEAVASVASAFRLPDDVDLTSFDPVAAALSGDSTDERTDEKVFAVQTQVLNTITTFASFLAGAGTIALVAASDAVAAELAQRVVEAEPDAPIDLSDASTLEGILTGAALRTGLGVSPIQDTAPDAAAVTASLNAKVDEILAGGGDGIELLSAITQVAIVAQGDAADVLAETAALQSSGGTGWIVDSFSGAALDAAVAAAADELGDIDGGETLSAGDDEFSGTDRGDAVDAGDGDDLIRGLEGNDRLIGGAGSDQLFGGAGNDVLFGDTVLPPQASADLAAAVLNHVTDPLLSPTAPGASLAIAGFHGDGADDSLEGGAGNDVIFGQGGNDHILGGDGDDWLAGGGGNDRLTGGDGADAFYIGSDADGVLVTGQEPAASIASDVITDFTSGVDRFVLGADLFGGAPLIDGFNFEVIETAYDGTNGGSAQYAAGNASIIVDGTGAVVADTNGAQDGYTILATIGPDTAISASDFTLA